MITIVKIFYCFLAFKGLPRSDFTRTSVTEKSCGLEFQIKSYTKYASYHYQQVTKICLGVSNYKCTRYQTQ